MRPRRSRISSPRLSLFAIRPAHFPFRASRFALQTSRAFTLLEVILAAAIFAIGSAALFIAFRTGTRAWEAGHNASELFQSARITQDVLTRDFANLFYRSDEEYNRTFRGHLQQVSQYRQQLAQAEEMRGDERDQALGALQPQGFSLDSIAIPIDLSFHGEDSGQADTISFARSVPARHPDDLRYGGLRRIRYYVQDGTLYREETTVQGLRDNSNAAGLAGIDGALREEIATRFNREGEEPPPPVLDKEGNVIFEFTPPLAEPLCDGVEMFNIAYGMYRFEQWNEHDSWESNSHQYRFPEEDEPELGSGGGFQGIPQPEGSGRLAGIGALPESGFNPGSPFMPGGEQKIAMVDGVQMAYQRRPDDLPGYVAIQLGMRDAKAKGRLRSFTFYFSLPQGQEEFDTTLADEPIQGDRGRGRGERGGRRRLRDRAEEPEDVR